MKSIRVRSSSFISTVLVLAGGVIALGSIALAADAPRPLAPSAALSLRAARVIIDGAGAFAREKN